MWLNVAIVQGEMSVVVWCGERDACEYYNAQGRCI
jgi:hypothetical protein